MNETELAAYADEIGAAAAEIAAASPGLPDLTVAVMASDLISMRRWLARYEAGEVTAEQAIRLTGSYYRWTLALTMVGRRLVSREWFAAEACGLWQSADPDDTSPENLGVWRSLAATNGGYLRDGRPLPGGRLLTVYRGGAPYVPGIAWTTDPKVAGRFARGAGLRIPVRGGTIIRGEVRRSDVLAYITGRNEAEVIVDPRRVVIRGEVK